MNDPRSAYCICPHIRADHDQAGCNKCGCTWAYVPSEPAAVPESAIEPEPQRITVSGHVTLRQMGDCPYAWTSDPVPAASSAIEPEPQEGIYPRPKSEVGYWPEVSTNSATYPAASSAIEVAPQDYNDMLPGRDFAERAYNKAQRPSVAPGEAQREPELSPDDELYNREMDRLCEPDDFVMRAGFQRGWLSSRLHPAVPSEVAPSREQRLENALRNMERVIVEVYPGHVEPDDEHLEGYKAVWNAVMTARAALEGK